MTFGEKLKEARKNAGLSQEELAEKISVSRSAVAKWETDKGVPDVENLKAMAKLLDVSIDYLLEENGSLDVTVIKEPINLQDYANLYTSKRKTFSKKDKLCDGAVRARFPEAEIHFLVHRQIMTKKEKRVQAILLWVFDAPANSVEFLQSVQNADKHFYLVEDKGKQYLVLVTDEFMEIRQLARPVENMKKGKKFEIGGFRFYYSVAI